MSPGHSPHLRATVELVDHLERGEQGLESVDTGRGHHPTTGHHTHQAGEIVVTSSHVGESLDVEWSRHVEDWLVVMDGLQHDLIREVLDEAAGEPVHDATVQSQEEGSTMEECVADQRVDAWRQFTLLHHLVKILLSVLHSLGFTLRKYLLTFTFLHIITVVPLVQCIIATSRGS